MMGMAFIIAVSCFSMWGKLVQSVAWFCNHSSSHCFIHSFIHSFPCLLFAHLFIKLYTLQKSLMFCSLSDRWTSLSDVCESFDEKQGMSKMLWNFLLFCKVQSLHKLVRLGSFNITEPLYYTVTHISFVTQTFKSFHRFLSMVLLFSLIGQNLSLEFYELYF